MVNRQSARAQAASFKPQATSKILVFNQLAWASNFTLVNQHINQSN
jgi:hypothetical protein